MTGLERFDDAHTIVLVGEAPAAARRVLKVGDVVGGQYKIKSLLGHGGMGYVFCAEHTMMRSDYALKILAPEQLNDESRERFEVEGRAIAKLVHPNIVKVYNMGLDEGDCPFYVMDLLDGTALSDHIAVSHGLALDECLEIFIQIAAGLGYAHGKGIVHRDVKPSNIVLIPEGGGARRVKIVDFGIAKILPSANLHSQSQTATGVVLGSPLYMSPEQCMGKAVDHRSDIYSLGCTFFEALCGQPPYRGQNAMQTLMMHQNADIPSILALGPAGDLPRSVDDLLFRMMAKRPEDRYQTMQNLMHDLGRLREGKPIGGVIAGASDLSSTAALKGFDSGTRRRDAEPADIAGHTDRRRTAMWVLAVSLPLLVALCCLAYIVANNRLKAAPSAIKPEVGPETLGVKAGNDADSRIFDEGAALDAARPKEKRTHLSDSEIAEADRAYKLCPSIVSKRVSDHGRKVRMLHFPSRPIGAVSSADNKVSDRPAKGDFYIDPGTVLSLNVDASKCAAIDLPDIFKKIGAGEFTALTLQCRRDRDTSQQTPSDKSEGQRLTSILQTVSSWSHLSALNIFDADINEAVLTALDDMKSLTTVEFHRCIWKSQDIRRRPFISRLTVLQLDDVHNAGQIIRCLAGSSNIRQLKLFNLEVSKEALLELNSCPKFSQLDLQDILTDDNFLKALTQIKTLRNVKISPSLSKEQLAILVGGPHAIAIDDRGYSLQQRQEFNRSVPGLRWERQ